MNTDKCTMNEFTKAAADLAERGAELAFELMGRTNIHLKPDRSIVTEADVRVQDMIVEGIRHAFPDHGILAEEASPRIADDELAREYVWAIDPIDGTRNYAAGIPAFTCSIALLHRGRPVVAAVALPQPKTIWSATHNGPATMNGQPVHVAEREFDLDGVLAVSGSQLDHVPAYLPRWVGRHIVRDFGTGAWHLAMVACGRLTAALSLKGALWDIAAGALLVEQAGGQIISLDKSRYPCDSPLWPIDLPHYQRQSLPLAACSATAAPALIKAMAR